MITGFKTREQIDLLIISLTNDVSYLGYKLEHTKGKLEKATLEMEVKNRIATINKLTKEMNREWKKS